MELYNDSTVCLRLGANPSAKPWPRNANAISVAFSGPRIRAPMARTLALLIRAIFGAENMLSQEHVAEMKQLDPTIKFGIVYWFTGVVNWFRENDAYRVLFERNGSGSDAGEKITIGMNEIALYLKKEGYGDPATMNLIEYFDAQVKALKDAVAKALADGVKPEKIAQKTGIPLTAIARLS